MLFEELERAKRKHRAPGRPGEWLKWSSFWRSDFSNQPLIETKERKTSDSETDLDSRLYQTSRDQANLDIFRDGSWINISSVDQPR